MKLRPEYLIYKQVEKMEEQNKAIEKLKEEVNSLKQELAKYLIKAESLDKQIEDLYERVKKLEKR
jgi:predicted  nucleic acid-binding Zn-ribbon protein